MKPYQGKNAIIFGGSSGIGLATVELLKARGAGVLVADLTPPLNGAAASTRWVNCDVCDPDQVGAAVHAARELGSLSWMVYSAGIQRYGTVATTSVEEYDYVQAVNARGAFLAARACISRMHSGGAMVLVSSVQGIACQNGVAAYAASKGALEALTRAMAIDHACDGIRVNAVLPGTVDTPMVRASAETFCGNGSPDELVVEWGRSHPVNRVAHPQEVANIIAFLLSDEASFVTGASYRVDGGLLAQLPVRL